MKYSEFFGKTSKTEPKDTVAINAKLLSRGGFIDQLMSGSYTLMPLGLRVVKKIEQIIREEMNSTDAQEVLMPLLHPKEIWNETGRWDSAKEVMYQFEKNEKEYALSFTHEEIVLDLIRKHATTYRDLPIKIYHFSTKFRNELRAKSGILRGREFLMKDLYSAHLTADDLDKYYWEVKDAYLRVFKRLGLRAKVVEAGGGVFTESHTHEFQVEAPSGEDTIYFCNKCDFAQNDEIATVKVGDKCPNCDGEILTSSFIEVGNIFRFGTVYSEKMNVSVTDDRGHKQFLHFGSYGIGLTRMMGVLAELFNDEKGLIWPENVAPYKVYLISIGKDDEANHLYNELTEKGIEVLFDDRENKNPGEKFGDCDLIGIPYRVVLSGKLEDGKVEVKKRTEGEVLIISKEELFQFL